MSDQQPTRDIAFYDGACGLCRRSVRIISALDWLNRIDTQDMTKVPESDLPFPMEEALKGMPMRTREGRALIGFDAVRRALIQTPVGALVMWLFYVPGFSHVGRRVYQWIADNRSRDVCRTDA